MKVAGYSGVTEQRIVLHHTSGVRAGLYQIMGTLSQLKASLKSEDLPGRLDGVSLGDHTGSVLHAGTKPRYILYREWNDPTPGQFNDFHPEQQ